MKVNWDDYSQLVWIKQIQMIQLCAINRIRHDKKKTFSQLDVSDVWGKRKDVGGWIENHLPHADGHKLEYALFLEVCHGFTKIVHSDQQSPYASALSRLVLQRKPAPNMQKWPPNRPESRSERATSMREQPGPSLPENRLLGQATKRWLGLPNSTSDQVEQQESKTRPCTCQKHRSKAQNALNATFIFNNVWNFEMSQQTTWGSRSLKRHWNVLKYNLESSLIDCAQQTRQNMLGFENALEQLKWYRSDLTQISELAHLMPYDL